MKRGFGVNVPERGSFSGQWYRARQRELLITVRSVSSGSSVAQGMKSEANAAFTASRSMRATSVERKKSPRRHSLIGRPCMVRCLF